MERVEFFHHGLSLIEIPADPHLPWDPLCILEKGAPTRNGAQPGRPLAGHGRLARPQVPHTGASGGVLGLWESLYHSLLAIHKQPPTHPPHTHTFSPLSPLLRHTQISIFVFFHSDRVQRRPGCRARLTLK